MLKPDVKCTGVHLKKNCSTFPKARVFSFLLHFVFSENNLKINSTQLPENVNACECSRNTSLALNCLKIQHQDYTKRNTETDIRCRETYAYATKKPQLGIFWTGKQTNHKMCLEIFLCVFCFVFKKSYFCMLKI